MRVLPRIDFWNVAGAGGASRQPEGAMMTVERDERLMALASAWELLSVAFLPPAKSAVEALCSGEFADELARQCDALGLDEPEACEVVETIGAYAGCEPEALYHEILQEHTRLFVGEHGPAITPFVGVRESERKGSVGVLFLGRTSVEMERFMKSRGIGKDVAGGQANDPLDHIGSVCEFMEYLCLANARAIKVPEGFSVRPDDCGCFARSFVRDYARWLSDELAAQSRCAFLRAMGRYLVMVCSALK